MQHPAAARASFFLQIGLRSFAGGNPAAALSRLQVRAQSVFQQRAVRHHGACTCVLPAASSSAMLHAACFAEHPKH